MKARLRVKWHDSGREPSCPPNPNYPNGLDIDMRRSTDEKSCSTDLPYPAKRCGMFIITCQVCGLRTAVSTAGRPDDPRSIIVPCKVN